MTSAGPTFLILGAARSGTTALVEGLGTHPHVFVTTPKEPHYFALHARGAAFTGPGDASTINRVAVTDKDAYFSLYPTPPNRYLARGDASVSSLYYYEDAIPEIQRLAPRAQLVVLLREPTERAFSAFGYMASRGFETHGRFFDAVADEDRRVADGWHHLWHYTRMSQYAPALNAFQEAFGRDHVGVWFYDDLESDYQRTVSEILRFIGTQPADGEGVGVQRVNASGEHRSKVLKAGIHAVTRNELARRAVKGLTSYRAREAVRRRLLRRREMDPAVYRELAPRFAADLVALRGLVPADRAPSWLREAR